MKPPLTLGQVWLGIAIFVAMTLTDGWTGARAWPDWFSPIYKWTRIVLGLVLFYSAIFGAICSWHNWTKKHE